MYMDTDTGYRYEGINTWSNKHIQIQIICLINVLKQTQFNI